MDKKCYVIQRTDGTPDWSAVQPLEIDFFFDRGSNHRPRTQARVMYDNDQLYVRFDVTDRCVRAVAENYQDSVCKDSCVEFFVQPKPGASYFNFEVNAGGTMLLYSIPVAADGSARMDQLQPVPFDQVKEMQIRHSLPSRIEPEITEPCEWTVEYNIPFSLFEQYGLLSRPLAGQTWRANFYKCADATSHPHWGMWSPILDGRSFHRPEYFSELVFKE